MSGCLPRPPSWSFVLLCLAVAAEASFSLSAAKEKMRAFSRRTLDKPGVPPARSAAALGAVPLEIPTLWPRGAPVRYVVDTRATDPADPSSFLLKNDSRVVAAIVEWEEKTCVRFSRCDSPSSCPRPYILFVSDPFECDSPVGVDDSGVNVITVSCYCGTGEVIQNIGYSLGLVPEHTRSDRDDYIFVDEPQALPGYAPFFAASPHTRLLGPYNYDSVTHPQAYAFARGVAPTVVSPQPIGQRSRVSKGDAEAISWLYNECSETFTQPVCIASLAADVTHRVPSGTPFKIEFNVMYNASVTVSYNDTTAANFSASVEDGDSVGGEDTRVVLTYYPSAAEEGSEVALAVTFSTDEVDGADVTCAVVVELSAAPAVCFGKDSTDPTVCSGRGACTANKARPCVCSPGFGGFECEGSAACPENLRYSFDTVDSLWQVGGALDTAFFAAGGGAMRIVPPLAFMFVQPSTFSKISFNFAYSDTADLPILTFRDDTAAYEPCWSMAVTEAQDLALYHNAIEFAGLRLNPGVYYFAEFLIDNALGVVTLRIDGLVVIEDFPLDASCTTTGVRVLVAHGGLWMDELDMLCHSFIVPAGTLAKKLDQSEFVEGGLLLTLAIEGGVESWNESEETKQALVDALVADTPADNGWNELKGVMLDASLVHFNGSLATIGPLRAAPSYSVQQESRLSVRLDGSMFASHTLPSGHSKLYLRIPGTCDSTDLFTFDPVASDPLSPAFAYNTNLPFPPAVSSCLEYVAPGQPHILPLAATRPRVVSFYVHLPSSASPGQYHGLEIRDRDEAHRLLWITGFYGSYAYRAGGHLIPVSMEVPDVDWLFTELVIDWSARVFTVRVNGESVVDWLVALPAGMQGFSSVMTYSFRPSSCLARLKFECAARPPTFAPPTPCFNSGNDTLRLPIYAGTDPLAATHDVVSVLPPSSSCQQAAAFNSQSHGFLTQKSYGILWSVGSVSVLSPATAYTVCYYIASLDQWLQLEGSLQTC
ncbi:Zinc metalloproteinase nas-14 [Diplonema papillatum]|nr:Zinc metalloproteinase nas-14 [Diplonema papillatum]